MVNERKFAKIQPKSTEGKFVQTVKRCDVASSIYFLSNKVLRQLLRQSKMYLEKLKQDAFSSVLEFCLDSLLDDGRKVRSRFTLLLEISSS